MRTWKRSDEMVPLHPYGPVIAEVTNRRSEVGGATYHVDDLTTKGFELGDCVLWDDDDDDGMTTRLVHLPDGWRIRQSRDRCHNNGTVIDGDGRSVAFVEATWESEFGLLVEVADEPIDGLVFIKQTRILPSCLCK